MHPCRGCHINMYIFTNQEQLALFLRILIHNSEISYTSAQQFKAQAGARSAPAFARSRSERALPPGGGTGGGRTKSGVSDGATRARHARRRTALFAGRALPGAKSTGRDGAKHRLWLARGAAGHYEGENTCGRESAAECREPTSRAYAGRGQCETPAVAKGDQAG